MKIKAIATVNNMQCICRACEGYFKRNADRDGYRFRWMVNLDRGPGSSRCIIASCTERDCIVHTGIATKDRIADLLHEQVLSEPKHLLTPMCVRHYRHLHQLLHAEDHMYTEKRCVTCHALIHSTARHCPNPTAVSRYFNINGDTAINITKDDYVCTACYKHHQSIVQTVECMSTDEELKQLLSFPHSFALWDGNSYTPHITAALKGIITRLGDVLMKKFAVLFPDVYRCFILLVTQEASAAGMTATESQIMAAVPKKYFFGYITSFFGKHMVCQCKHKAHGVLLYRKGTDLGEVLSRTLKTLHHSSRTLLGYSKPEADDDTELLTFCDMSTCVQVTLKHQ